MYKKIIRSPLFWFLVVTCALFLPNAIIAPAEFTEMAIVSVIGVDIEEEEYVLSILALVPVKTEGYSENYKLIMAKGPTILNAFNNLELQSSRNLGLIHAEVIVLGNNVLSTDIKDALDSFTRTNHIANNTSLIATNGKAYELLDAAISLETSSNEKLGDIALFNEKRMCPFCSTIESYLRSEQGASNSSFIGKIELINDQSFGINAEGSGLLEPQSETGNLDGGSSGESQQSSSGSSLGAGQNQGIGGESSKKIISNTRKAIVTKDYRQILELSGDEVEGLGWISSDIINEDLNIDNVSVLDKEISLLLQVRSKTVSSGIKYINNRPIIVFKMEVSFSIDGIEDQKKFSNIDDSYRVFLNKEITKKIENGIKQNFSSAYNKLKNNKCDLFNFHDRCRSVNSYLFDRFKESLEDPSDYLKGIQILFDFDINIKL